MRKKLQKVQLFSIDQQRRRDAWLNDTTPLPAMPARPDTEFTERTCIEIAKYTAFFNDVPSALRINPCSILGLPRNRWEVFPFFYEGHVAGIAVISDLAVPANEIICESWDQALDTMERIYTQEG
jgi:hypothetical protein